MKTDRMLGIIAVLQQNKRVTAPYLAERFEVSRRTINRDIEDICRAGIPIVTTQGKGGGIALMEGFRLDASVFTVDELRNILTGLRTLESVTPRSPGLAEKLAGGKRELPLEEELAINLSSFYKASLPEKIQLLREAVRKRKLVTFQYYYPKGEEEKRVEPYRVIFHWSDWYLYGYCVRRQGFRLYKLQRLWELELLEEGYRPREFPEEAGRFGARLADGYRITASFDPQMKYRLVEEYGPDCYTVLPDGRLEAELGFTGPERAAEWLLSFGGAARVTAPEDLRRRIRQAAEEILKNDNET